MAMNLVVLTGRLTKDPELKYGASGTAYCRFTIAVGRAFQKDQTDCQKVPPTACGDFQTVNTTHDPSGYER